MNCPYCGEEMQRGTIITARNRVPCWFPEGEKKRRSVSDYFDEKGSLFSRSTAGSYEIDSFYCSRCKKIVIEADLKL